MSWRVENFASIIGTGLLQGGGREDGMTVSNRRTIYACLRRVMHSVYDSDIFRVATGIQSILHDTLVTQDYWKHMGAIM
ncbi:hypothetical protein CO251_11485 [Sulfobacillus sp. hq2]|nr:hypothetical protein CO251_11485 [Sulfobacillus sp. hq2]